MRTSEGAAPARGFTLIEVAIALMIVGFLVAGLLVPLTEQVRQQRAAQTSKTLADAREALLGYAASNRRLPCPASATSNGAESFAVGGSAANGNCSNFYDGFLPAATLGLGPVDGNGYAIDGWGTRIRYAVWTGSISPPSGAPVANAFTRTNGIRDVTIASAVAADRVFVCAANPSPAATCSGANLLTNEAVFVVFSLGPNANAAGAGTDEAENVDADRVFVSHVPAPAAAPGGEFDDIAVWQSVHILINRLITAGQLP